MSLPHSPLHYRKRLASLAGMLLVFYLVSAYLLIPALWVRHARRHPALDDIPRITHTRSDIHGDPLNVALIGRETQVKQILLAAGWFPADPLTLRSCFSIASATVLKRPYPDAPVSNLYLFGRKQDLAFEKPVGNNPRERNHVRFWHATELDDEGHSLWVGSATFDRSVGLSRTTGQVTHHIAADVDDERDLLFRDLERTGQLAEVYTVKGFHETRQGRNGGGDPWHTDGALDVGAIAVNGRIEHGD